MRGRGERLSAVGRAPGDLRTGPPRIRRSRSRQIYGLLVLAPIERLMIGVLLDQHHRQ